jgi:GNAT superfamily N-acetyltransferase
MIRIEPLSKKTLSEAIELLESIFEYRPDQEQIRKNLGDSISNQGFSKEYWVAISVEGKVIGTVGLYKQSWKRNNDNILWLGWFGVHPSYRRRGIGSMLLNFAVSEAKKKKARELRLYTSREENEMPAHRLYKKYNFRESAYDKERDKLYFLKKL